MSLIIRNLLIRVSTSEGVLGVSIPFSRGLNILRADNSSGKSTCIQSMVYAMGLEGMLGASHDIPLPHAVTDFIEFNGIEYPVLESEVLLEVENAQGDIRTFSRTIKGNVDKHLITVWYGPLLSDSQGIYQSEDFYVRVKGAAIRPAGFHFQLATFIGWELPKVLRFDNTDVPLYVECIFPLLMVEQKRGWSGILANFPTQFGIREVSKRAVEFLLKLDAYELLMLKQHLRERAAKVNAEWKEVVGKCEGLAASVDGLLNAAPVDPVAEWPPISLPNILLPKAKEWLSLRDILIEDKKEIARLTEEEIPKVEQILDQAKAELLDHETTLSETQLIASNVLEEIDDEESNLERLRERLEALEEDLGRYKDVMRLRELGSKNGLMLVSECCPTCHQSIPDSLLPRDLKNLPMSIDENIRYLEEQKYLLCVMKDNALKVTATKQQMLKSLRSQMNELRERIRALRKTLVSDGQSPSVAAIQQRLRLEEKIGQRQRIIELYEQQLIRFAELSCKWKDIQDQISKLPKDTVSTNDIAKLLALEELFKSEVEKFGLSSLSPSSLAISCETYRPSREGLDLHFDLSASDLIRCIWAYLIGLLELSRQYPTNHPGLLVFDEPRQQSTARPSLKQFFIRTATSKSFNQQVIIATSEDKPTITSLLSGLEHSLVDFKGKILSKM